MDLTGKDKAVAEALIANGFEIDRQVEEGEFDEDDFWTEDEFKRYVEIYGGIENWSVHENEFDFSIMVEEFNSKTLFVKVVDDEEEELVNTCELIRNTLVSYEVAQAQIPLFDVSEF